MNRRSQEEFHAKIMLFGEYGLICDSMGLTIPYQEFKGKFSFIGDGNKIDPDFAEKSNKHLKKFANYIRELSDTKILKCDFNIGDFEQDITEGLYFESSIPQGFGIGSSGALVAALYDRYVDDKVPNDREELDAHEIARLKDELGQLESYFHGVSSGVDPLNCYLKQPLLIENKSSINKVGLPSNQKVDDKSGMFLINTGAPGETEPLVKYFVDKCKQDGFLKMLKEEMIPSNDSCIRSFIKGEMKEFFHSLKSLSKFLLKNLTPMIPKAYHKIWEKGLEKGSYYLKLCGSGGGGFLLGFAEDMEKAKKELKESNVDIIPLANK
jgi:mevalonate kinase